MWLDRSGVFAKNSAICGFFLIRYGDPVVLYTLTAILWSNIVDNEWEISKLAVSVNFSNSVTLPVVLHFDGWSAKAVIVFVVGGIVRASSKMKDCGFVVVSLEAVLTWFVKCGNYERPCVVSMTTLLFLMKCHSIFDPVNFFITRKCSAKLFSPISNLSVVFANGFSNWPFATWIWKLGGSPNLGTLFGAFAFIVSKFFWAIALASALDSTNASTIRLFLKSRGT